MVADSVGIFGSPGGIQIDEGREGKNEIWTYLCRERLIEFQFQGVGAHPWLSDRRNGLARGIYDRVNGNYRFSSGQILWEVQWCLNTMISASGFSAYQMVFGRNPVELFGWEDNDATLMSTQHIPGGTVCTAMVAAHARIECGP